MRQVNSAASRDTLSRAFAKLHKAQPGSDYSSETQDARAQLLRAALDCLTDTGTRRLYDQQLLAGAAQVGLDVDQLPAALSLLEEAGDTSAVLQ